MNPSHPTEKLVRNYDGPTLHELLDDIILNAPGPIAISAIVRDLMQRATPELLYALGDELAYINRNRDTLSVFYDDPNPQYITRYQPNTGSGTIADQPIGDDDEFTPIESGQTLFEITKSIIEAAEGPLAVSELVAEIFKRAKAELFYDLGDERFDWEDEDQPEIVWEEGTTDLLIFKEPPAAATAREYHGPTLPELFEIIFSETGEEPVTSLDLAEYLFESAPVGFFEELAAEHQRWVAEGRPEINYGEDTSERAVISVQNTTTGETNQPSSASQNRPDTRKWVNLLLTTAEVYRVAIEEAARKHPHPVVTETLLTISYTMKEATENLQALAAAIFTEHGDA